MAVSLKHKIPEVQRAVIKMQQSGTFNSDITSHQQTIAVVEITQKTPLK